MRLLGTGGLTRTEAVCGATCNACRNDAGSGKKISREYYQRFLENLAFKEDRETLRNQRNRVKITKGLSKVNSKN